jgi:hypothetical protein
VIGATVSSAVQRRSHFCGTVACPSSPINRSASWLFIWSPMGDTTPFIRMQLILLERSFTSPRASNRFLARCTGVLSVVRCIALPACQSSPGSARPRQMNSNSCTVWGVAPMPWVCWLPAARRAASPTSNQTEIITTKAERSRERSAFALPGAGQISHVCASMRSLVAFAARMEYHSNTNRSAPGHAHSSPAFV